MEQNSLGTRIGVKTQITLVVPVYNEAAAILDFVDAVAIALANEKLLEVEFLFVNDGSTDTTLNILSDLTRELDNVSILDLSRNFGKEAALSAGLEFANGDVVIPIDVDLQDPPTLIPQMIEKWREGFDVVLAKRIDRSSDTYAKRVSAKLFYRLNNFLTQTKIPEDVGDFRLLDRKVVVQLRKLPEASRFMKGIFAWVGFETFTINYTREPRSRGKTKFNGVKLTKLAIDGIVNFSIAPLRLSTIIGLVFSILGFIYGAALISRTLLFGEDLPGYPSIMVTILFLGGIQLLALGVIGEYVGRTFIETKNRPVFLVNKFVEKSKNGS